ncbi:MFS transporter [Mycobacterium sp.]|uniref:MFS transporter n=1 Tax=Mycobacterium sp. TaxID=1785 RepID=UPI0025F37505|nr:MFS transporter [Mycobacterium sp.]
MDAHVMPQRPGEAAGIDQVQPPQETPPVIAVGHHVDEGLLWRRIGRRLLPLLLVLYVVAFLDRVNIATAALRMNADLGLSASTYGLISGSFFLGYVAFQVPANWVFHRMGIRRWLAVLLTGWGLFAAAPAFVDDAAGLIITRIGLGVAEAGFYPAVVCYLGRWFPPAVRARALAVFLLAIPIANIVGMPVSSLLVAHGALGGLAGWRVMFLAEGLPAAVLALVALRGLTDSPEHADWLSAAEKTALARHLVADSAGRGASFAAALTDRRMYTLAAINAGLYFAQFGVQFFVPLILTTLYPHASITMIGGLGAACFTAAAVAMLGWGRRSDRRGERTTHLAAPALTGAAVMGGAVACGSPLLLALGVAITTVCVLAAIPILCSITTACWTGAAAAGGIAAVNSIASIASGLGPYVTGFVTDATGGYDTALLLIAAALAGTGLGALALGRKGSSGATCRNPAQLGADPAT